MENNRKLLFFDIDKTLLTPYPWTVPDSARLALKEAHDNGHLLFINSGRTYAMIPKIIKGQLMLAPKLATGTNAARRFNGR